MIKRLLENTNSKSQSIQMSSGFFYNFEQKSTDSNHV